MSEEKDLVAKVRLVVGCDAFMDSLRRHRSLQNLVCCNIDSLPFRDRSFDLLTINMVAEHLINPKQTLSEFARVLDNDGLLVVHTPNAESYEVQLIRLGWKIVPKSLGLKLVRFLEHREPVDVFPTFYRANTRSDLRRLIPELGLTEVEFQLIEGRPFFYFLAPLSILEILFARFLRLIRKPEVSSANFLGVYRRTRAV
jgi:SAM-dependent methyltransferase